MNERLAALARQRTEGPWELLATAAGNPDAIQKSCAMLSGAVLDDFFHPDWMVEERVEAVCAFDPTVLAALAREWPNPVKSASPFIRTAWRVGLRHLLPIMPLNREDLAVPELVEEASVLWQPDAAAPITWDQAFDLLDAQPIFNYTLVRRLARHPLVGPLPSRAGLIRCPAWMLPLLRGQVHQLEPAARDYLALCGQRCLGSDLRAGTYVAQSVSVDKATGTSVSTAPIKYIPLGDLNLEGNASAAPPIIELCREIGEGLVEDLGDALADQIQRLHDPKLAAPLVYLLLSRWTLP